MSSGKYVVQCRGVVKSGMTLLNCCRRNFEELAIVTQMLSAEGSAELLPGLQFYCFSSFRMIAAKVAQRPHRHEVLDKQSALPAPPSALWPRATSNLMSSGKSSSGAVRSTMRMGSGEVYHGVACD